MENSFSLNKKVKKNIPIKESFFCEIKSKVLGKKYNLSVVFIGKKAMQAVNFKYRQKNKPTDILSFPISETEGEIFINLDCSKTKAKEFGREFTNYLYFIFIHGLLHLKGFEHSSRMESEEQKIRKFFGV